MAGILHLGDFHPHLEAAFARRLQAVAADGDAGHLLVVVANRLLAEHLPRRAAELGAPAAGLRPRALEDLIEELAAPALAADGRRRLPSWQQPLLVAEVLRPALRRRGGSVFGAAAQQAGLYRMLAATLRDLRDAGLAPEELRGESAASAKLAELAELYRLYLRALDERLLADDAAAAAAAATALGRGALAGRPLFLYGLYDLVGRQRRVVEALLGARPVDVFFPWRENEPHAFAFARPLQEWFVSQGLEREGGEEPESPDSRLALLKSRLFAAESGGGPAPWTAADGTPDRSVRFLSAPGPEREAREVVRLLAAESGASSLVLLRGAEAAAPYYRSLRRATGEPLHLSAGEPWSRRPHGRTLLALLALAADRRDGVFQRAAVEDLLASGALHPDLFPTGSNPGRWVQALRRRGLVQDLAGWRRLVAEHAQAAAQPELPFAAPAVERAAAVEEERDPALRRELPFLAAWVERLLAASERLGESGRTWPLFVRRLTELGVRWLAPAAERDPLLAALAPLAGLEGVAACSWRLARQAVEELLDAPGPDGGEPYGAAPAVVDLVAARGVTAERVVVPGLVERGFPRRPRLDPILLDEERSAINRALDPARGPGRALPLKEAAALAEERLLLRLAAGAARRELVLAWPRSGEDGQSLVPSTFLLAAGRAVLGRELGFEELREAGGELGIERVPLSPLAAAGESDRTALLGSEYDLARVVAARRVVGPGASALSYLLDVHPRFGAALEMERRRHGFAGARRLSEYDGVVGEDLGRAWLEERRRSDGAVVLSASALEAYARCSFHFLHREVLRLDSQPGPERRLDLDPREVGLLYHGLLRELFLRLEAEGLLPLGADRLERAARLVAPTLDDLLARDATLAGEGAQALWLHRRGRLETDARAVLQTLAAEDAGWRPRRYEQALGAPGREPVVAVGETALALGGRVDRVDEGPAGLRVVDYKTGRLRRESYPEAPEILGGQRMQLALYQKALHATHGLYLGVEGASGYRAIAWSPADFARAAPEVEGVVAAAVAGLARGEFFQVERGGFCDRFCPYGEICGPGRARLVERKSADPRVRRAALWRRLELDPAPQPAPEEEAEP